MTVGLGFSRRKPAQPLFIQDRRQSLVTLLNTLCSTNCAAHNSTIQQSLAIVKRLFMHKP